MSIAAVTKNRTWLHEGGARIGRSVALQVASADVSDLGMNAIESLYVRLTGEEHCHTLTAVISVSGQSGSV